MRAWIFGALVGVAVAVGGCASGDRGKGDDGSAIDSSLFEATGKVERQIVAEDMWPVSADEAFDTFTDADRLSAALAGTPAFIDLRIGGRMELWFGPNMPEGQRGSEGCQILSYIPGRMLSFSWNAPPTLPEAREKRSWVVMEFEPVAEEATRVRLTHTGFGEGEEWDETRAYFESAWPNVLAAVRLTLEETNPMQADLNHLAFLVGRWQGEAPGGGVIDASWSPPHAGVMTGAFRWTQADGNVLLYELTRFVEYGKGQMDFEIRHFDGDFEPWEAEAGGPTMLRFDSIGPDIAGFTAVNDEMDLRTIKYQARGDTLTATVTQRGQPAPLVLTVTRLD